MATSPTLFESTRTRVRTPSRAPARRRSAEPRTTTPSLLREPAAHPPRDTELPQQGGGLTLDDLVVGVWEGLSAHRTVPCPACGGAMAPRYGSGPGPVGGRCGGCGTTIA
jgi:hypothetical protein